MEFKKSSKGTLVCFFCDYFGIFFVLFIVCGIACAIRFTWIRLPVPELSDQSLFKPGIEMTQTPFISQATLIPTYMPDQIYSDIPELLPTNVTVETPEFILVFIPLNWSSEREVFEEQARWQADFFIEESRISDYFSVSIILLEEGLEGVDLSSDSLTNEVVEFGMTNTSGDRYIGLTDGDIAPEGISDIVGWTMGNGYIGVVAESDLLSVSAHELGHTFGLCDEYDYETWVAQDAESVDGCPNPYPPLCPKEMVSSSSTFSMCDGLPTEDGRNSIMGPAIDGESIGYNTPCLEGLTSAFTILLEEYYQ